MQKDIKNIDLIEMKTPEAIKILPKLKKIESLSSSNSSSVSSLHNEVKNSDPEQSMTHSKKTVRLENSTIHSKNNDQGDNKSVILGYDVSPVIENSQESEKSKLQKSIRNISEKT